jgi:glycosyltransferase involved in cell wall biosynthesis
VGTASYDSRITREAAALAEAGFAVTVVDVIADRTQPLEEDIDGVHMQHIVMPGMFISARFKPWFLVKLVRVIILGIIQLLRTNADIYHAHIEKALPTCYIAARLRHKPLVFDVADLTMSDPVILRWRKLRSLALLFLAHVVPHCAGIISASPLYEEALRTDYHAAAATVIRNVPPYHSVTRDDRLRRKLGLGPDVRIALYQGNIQPSRGLDRLVHTAKFLEPGIVIVMMGNARETTLRELQALIASEGVADRVKIIPAVPYNELLDWTASADIGLTVYPLDYSLNVRLCLPNKLFEYLMAGLPVLSSNLEGISEVIRIYDVGHVVYSLEPEDVAAAIHSMLADPVSLDRMRQNGLQAAKNELHWEKERQQLIRLYDSILKPSNEGQIVSPSNEQDVLLDSVS